MLTKALAAVLLTWAGSWASDGSPPRPNIVLLLADDLGYGDLGCYGHERVSTPNIDGLARDGLRFTRMYSQTVCTPSRGAILTGRYPIRFGLIQDTSPFQYAFKSPVFMSHAQPGGIPDSERPVLPEMLASQGYRKAFIGKWHLGSGHQRQHLPLKYGFDFFYGIPDSHFFGCTKDSHFRWTDSDFFVSRLRNYQRKLTALVALVFTLWYIGYAGKRTIAVIITAIALTLLLERIYLSFLVVNPKSCILMQNNSIVEQPYNDDLLPPRLTRKALEFISTSANNNNPFFLFMSYPQVHLPPIVTERFRNRSGLGPYYDSVVEMDWSVGKIISLLKKRDVYKNTLIIFTSDNGPEHYNPVTGDFHEAALRGSTTFKVSGSPERIELLGAKNDVWEGGIRVPAIFVWPGVIAPGTESHHVASFIDIYPTICEVLNEKCPGKKFDGKTLVPRFTNTTSSSLHQYLMHHCDNGGVSAVTANRYKAHFRSCKAETFDPPLLFDIEKDPGESKPLDTEISKYTSLLTKIRQAVERHESSLESFPMQFGKIARPWFFLCDNPPFCSKSLDENDRFSDLYSE